MILTSSLLTTYQEIRQVGKVDVVRKVLRREVDVDVHNLQIFMKNIEGFLNCLLFGTGPKIERGTKCLFTMQ